MSNRTRRLLLTSASSWMFLTLTACNLCSDILKSQAVSPDEQLAARVFERNCGATSDHSTIVTLRKASDKHDANDEKLFVAKGQKAVSVTWKGRKNLLVSCSDCSRDDIFREVLTLGDTDVSFALGSR